MVEGESVIGDEFYNSETTAFIYSYSLGGGHFLVWKKKEERKMGGRGWKILGIDFSHFACV